MSRERRWSEMPVLGTEDIMQVMVGSEGPYMVLDLTKIDNYTDWSATDSRIVPCQHFGMVTVLLRVNGTNAKNCYIRVELSDKHYTDPSQISDSDFYPLYERSQVNTQAFPVLKESACALAMVGSEQRAAFSFPLRGAKSFRISYKKADAGTTVSLFHAQAILHQQVWMGWA